MGRRRDADQGERRTATLTVQLTPSERAALDARAADAGARLSEFARAALLGYRLRIKQPLTEQAVRELWAIGNNLNQLAHRANTTGAIDAAALGEALRWWRELVARLRE